MGKKYKLGYTQGVFDMFHIGHLNLLNNAKENCEVLIVGVNSDKLVQQYKNQTPVISENDRMTIISNIKSVDSVFITETLNKVEIFEKIRFDAIFIGDDWASSTRWQETSIQMKHLGVDVVFLSYTPNISSTILRPNEDCAVKE